MQWLALSPHIKKVQNLTPGLDRGLYVWCCIFCLCLGVFSHKDTKAIKQINK